MNHFSIRPPWIIWSLLVLFACIGVFLAFQPAAPTASVVILPPEFQVQKQSSRVSRIANQCMEWIKRHLLGPAKTIMLTAIVIDFSEPGATAKLALSERAFADTNGLEVWILDASELNAARARIEQTPGITVLARPRVQTADGVRGGVSITGAVVIDGTNRPFGHMLSFLPRLRQDSVELAAFFKFTQATTNWTTTGALAGTAAISIRTNLAVSARFRIPDGQGVFLLKSDRSLPHGRITGVIISSAIQRAK